MISTITEMLAKEKPELYKRLSQEQYMPFFKNMQSVCGVQRFNNAPDITPSEMSLCHTVYLFTQQHDGAAPTVAETAAALGVSTPAISRTLKNLEVKEYIRRSVNNSDRRIVHISLTENGERTVKESLDTIANVAEQVLSCFSDEELRAMLELHTKFTSAVTQAISEINQNT